jgi:hypothetical protein
MVALDGKGKPANVPRLILKTPQEKRKNIEIKQRRQERVKHLCR